VFRAQGRFLTALTTQDLVSRLRELLARGATLRQAEAKLKTPKSTLGRLAQQHNLPRNPPPGLPPEKQAKVRRLVGKGAGIREIAEQAEVSLRTAWLYRQLTKFRSLMCRSQTPHPCRPWRCPVGGELLNVTICIAHGTRKPPRSARP
jgi:hypothetical protein